MNYILTKENLSAVVNGQSYTVSRSDKLFERIIQAIKDHNDALAIDLLDKTKAIGKFSDGNVTVEGDVVKYKGQPVHNVITDRIVEFIAQGLPFEPLTKFLANLMTNPSKRAVEETYKFLEHRSLPLTEDGCFLAYKAVTNDFKDKHSQTFDNSVGKTVSIERNQVDDDARNGCSYGLHVGSIGYVKGFAHTYMGDKMLVVKVNPADVVSVPFDCNCEKMRVAKYVVLSEYVADLESPCYNAEEIQQPTQTVSKYANDSWKYQNRDDKGRFI